MGALRQPPGVPGPGLRRVADSEDFWSGPASDSEAPRRPDTDQVLPALVLLAGAGFDGQARLTTIVACCAGAAAGQGGSSLRPTNPGRGPRVPATRRLRSIRVMTAGPGRRAGTYYGPAAGLPGRLAAHRDWHTGNAATGRHWQTRTPTQCGTGRESESYSGRRACGMTHDSDSGTVAVTAVTVAC